MMQQATQDRQCATKRKRSISFTTVQRRAFKKYAKSFDTIVDAAESIGVDRTTLPRIISNGSCSQDTMDMLIEKGIIPAA